MRPRFAAVIVAGLLALGAGPSALAQDAESIKGTIRNPAGKPIEGVHLVVTRGGRQVGSDTTNAKGAWQVDVPRPGTYEVVLKPGTLPHRWQLRNKGGARLEHVTVAANQARTVIFPLERRGKKQHSEQPGSASPEPSPTPTRRFAGAGFAGRLAQLIVEGIKFGAIIAITAVGLSLVFGTTRLINFAHGELVTIGAMVAFFLSTSAAGPNLPLILAALIAVAFGGLVGAGIEVSLWRPLRKRSAGLIQMFIISIGLSLLLRHTILVLFKSRRQQYDQYTLQQELHLGPVSIAPRDLVILVLSLAILVAVALMLQRTRFGKATRAVSDNRDLAEASGIDVQRVILLVWIVGGGLAAIGGVFYGLAGAVYWDMGFNLLLLMFAAVILGGLGSAYGAIVGSFVIGLVAQLSTLWFSVELQNMWALLALIVVLLVRPQGLLGKAQRAG